MEQSIQMMGALRQYALFTGLSSVRSQNFQKRTVEDVEGGILPSPMTHDGNCERAIKGTTKSNQPLTIPDKRHSRELRRSDVL